MTERKPYDFSFQQSDKEKLIKETLDTINNKNLSPEDIRNILEKELPSILDKAHEFGYENGHDCCAFDAED